MEESHSVTNNMPTVLKGRDKSYSSSYLCLGRHAKLLNAEDEVAQDDLNNRSHKKSFFSAAVI